MEGFDPKTSFGYEVSKRYDSEPRGDEADTVAYLAAEADGGAALEFAIGSGRIAVPLAATGVRVDGVELSTDMVDRLREKPGGGELDVTIGDMSCDGTGRRYRLVYLVYNSITNLLTQDGQVRCFENVAGHLRSDGAFVLECGVPGPAARPQYVDAERVTADQVVLDVCRYDPVTQLLDENHVSIGVDGIVLSPIGQRLVYPSELDLMARIAGLRLRDRWGGWNGEPFTADSPRHVSVYVPADSLDRTAAG
ncbi:MAG: methyltransferase domain-containing protein [Stackebrandtia sp.]